MLSFPPHASAEARCPLSPTFSESLNSRGWGLDPDLDFVSSRWPCVWGGWWGFNFLIPKASGIGVRREGAGVPCHPRMHVPSVVKPQMGERPLGSRVPRLDSEEPLEASFCPVMTHCTLKYLSPAHGPPELPALEETKPQNRPPRNRRHCSLCPRSCGRALLADRSAVEVIPSHPTPTVD